MEIDPPAGDPQTTPSIRARNSSIRNTYRLSLKELKEILRDRRTIITLVAMPLLIYPLLSILLQKFYLSTATSGEKVTYRYVLEEVVRDPDGAAISGPGSERRLDGQQLTDFFIAQFINLGEAYVFPELQFPPTEVLKPLDDASRDPLFVAEFETRYFEDNSIRVRGDDEESLEELVRSGKADVGLRLIRVPGVSLRLEIIQLNDGISAKAASYVRKRIEKTNFVFSRMQVARAKMRWMGIPHDTVAIQGEVAEAAISMSSLVPLILILMTVTGAVYPAIDLTAGERERGTLEALIAAPVPRFQVLFAKFVGVLTVAMLTAVVNMLAMFSTLAAFGLLPILLGEGSLGWWVILQIFALLLLFAGFFSAVLLAVTSFARSFKEAQAYIIPVTLLSITPGIISLTPGLELSGVLTVIPLVNIVLLAREIMDGTASSLPAVVAITSTVLYGAAALSVAASIFGSDSILYGSQSSWRSMLRRPEEPTDEISATRAFACLAALFPLSFISLALVGRVPQWVADSRSVSVEQVSYAYQLLPFVISTIVVFVLVPMLFLWHGRIRIARATGIRPGSAWAWLAAVILGAAMWPLTGQLVDSVNQLADWLSGGGDQPEWKARLLEKAERIVEQWRTISPAIIVFCFSVVPAVCEEFFFRGVLLRSLALRNRAGVAILVSALAFGVFHTLSLTDLSSQKFLPSFLAGLLLAWLAIQSGSIVPGMVLHSLNNGILVTLAYYQNRLVESGWIGEQQQGFPAWGLGLAAGAFAIGCLLMVFLVRPTRRDAKATSSVSSGF